MIIIIINIAPTMYYIINIGSNLGDRRLNLSRAMRRVGIEFGEFEISHAMESTPWGFESEHPFLNIAMIFQSPLPPEDVQKKLQAIEKDLCKHPHRKSDGSYADRELDIDIVAIDDLIITTPELTIPHPRLEEREFFLQPLAEIAPSWQHPVSHLTASEMLTNLQRVKKNQDQ